nr:conotoxin J M14.5 [Conus magus]
MQSVQSVTRCCLLVLLLSALCVCPHPLGVSQPLPQQLNIERGIPNNFEPCKKLCVRLNPPASCKCKGKPDVIDMQRKRTELSMAP